MKEKFMRFMQGRNGIDDLGKALNMVSMALLILSMIIKWKGFYLLAILLIVYTYFRIFSKNIPKRYAENQKYRNWRYDFTVKMNQRKIYRFYRCPMCKQKVRVPKGRGKICITCPKCRKEFIRRS